MEQPSEWSFLFVVFHVVKQGYAKKQNFVKIIENRQNIHNFKLRFRIIFNKSKISNTSPTKNCVLPKPRYSGLYEKGIYHTTLKSYVDSTTREVFFL
jgi:hypothetical protein